MRIDLFKFFIIFCCTGIGGVLRYLLSFIPYLKSLDSGVLLSNIIACAIMGYLLAIPINNPMVKMGVVSLCGGLSTFSGYIVFSYLSSHGPGNSILYHVMSVGFGLLFFIGSYYSCKSLFA